MAKNSSNYEVVET